MCIRASHRFERVPVSDGASCLDLYDCQMAAATGDDVDLALRTSPVAVEHLISDTRQVSNRLLFTVSTELVFRCHGDSLSSARADQRSE